MEPHARNQAIRATIQNKEVSPFAKNDEIGF
jgi:hypothetical protein